MKMLGWVFVIAGLLCFSPSAFGELSVEDLEKIRQIVNEVEVRLVKRIDKVEIRLEKRITTEIEAQGNRIMDLRERIDFQGHLIIALIVAIIAFVAVPMGLLFINTTETAINKKQKLGRSAISKKKSKCSVSE